MENISQNAVAAFLALAPAASLGIGLAGPAQAQSSISSNQYATVSLSNYATGTPVGITSGTTIAPLLGNAVEGGSGAFWSITNSGAIRSADGVGISLSAPGSVSNAGTIAAGYNGLDLNAGGAVNNSGTITGGHIGVYTGNGLGSVSNSGLITSRTGDAVSLYSGGSFSNAATGQLIGGYSGVYGGGAGASIQNAGIISGTSFGVYLSGLSSVTNSGSISGGVDGVIDVGAHGSVSNTGIITGGNTGLRLGASGQVQNSGTITGGIIGVKLGTGSKLSNAASGLIQGGDIGLLAGNNVSVSNAGSILDNTVAGAELGQSDTLSNTGVIAGVTGIVATGGNITIANAGLIASTVPGGTAIALQGNDLLELDTGSQIIGDIDGGNSASQISLAGSGALTSNIGHFGANSGLAIAQDADWTASGNWTIANVTNSGTFQPGIIGTPLSLTGDFTQMPGGTTRVLVTPSQTTQFNITGAAQLGGNLVYILAPGAYAPVEENFLTATGGVTGSFASVSATQTPSQQIAQQSLSVPVALQISDSTRGADLVITQQFTIAPRDAALFADAGQVMALDAERASDTLLRHATGNAAPCPAGSLPAEYGARANIAGALASGFCAAGGWVEASGTDMSETDAYGARNAGFLAGIGRKIAGTDARIGVAAGYDETSLDDKSGGTASIDTMRLGLYGALPIGRLALSASVLDGIITGGTARATGAGGALARSVGNTVSGAVQAALPMQYGAALLAPEAGLQLAYVSAGPVRESAPNRAFAVTAGSSGGGSLRPYLRMEVARSFITASQLIFTPQASLGVTYQLGNPGGAVDLASADGTGFTARAMRLDAAAGQAMAGLCAGRRNWSLNLRYGAQVAGNWSSQTVTGALQIKF